jgi:hypothetical protein
MMFIWIIHHVKFAYVNHVPCWINKKKWTYYIVTLAYHYSSILDEAWHDNRKTRLQLPKMFMILIAITTCD